MHFWLADVFGRDPLGGNGCAVFSTGAPLSAGAHLNITRKARQFESVFVESLPADGTAPTKIRVFSQTEEMRFAGHPLLATAAALHFSTENSLTCARRDWILRIAGRDVPVWSAGRRGRFEAGMSQGAPAIGPPLALGTAVHLVRALHLDASDLACSPRVVSTGLRYLILPICRNLEQARIDDGSLARVIATVGADYAYVLDVNSREGRHWENDGSSEDIATASAAGPAAAFLVANHLAHPGEPIVISQGGHLRSPCKMTATVIGDAAAIRDVNVAGPVTIVAEGEWTTW